MPTVLLSHKRPSGRKRPVKKCRHEKPGGVSPRVSGRLLEVIDPIVRPKQRLSVTEWAEKHRVLNINYCAEPGPYRVSRTPYLREIMDCYTQPNVSRITFVKSSRVGGSDMMNNFVLYNICENPAPSLYVLPTEPDAKDEATGRLKSMIEDCPEAAQYIPYKGFATGKQITLRGARNIYMGWAAAPRTLIRKTVRDVYFDELDNCEQEVGALGNPMDVATERNTSYGFSARAFSDTTPTVASAAAWQDWQQSDQREHHVPCPHCGQYQLLTMKQIKWDSDKPADEIETQSLAWYQCAHCEEIISEGQRWWMVMRGVWVPKALTITEPLPLEDDDAVKKAALHGPDRWTPALTGEKKPTRRVGFHIWSAYSPFRTFSMIAAQFQRAHQDPAKLRVFVNQWLGQPWQEEEETASATDLKIRRQGAPPRGLVPAGGIKLVGAADVQKTHIWYEFRTWGYQRQSWLVAEGACETLEDFYEIGENGFDCQVAGDDTKVTPEGMSADVYVIDSGNWTDKIYDFVRSHAKCHAVKGEGQHGSTSLDWSVKPSKVEYTPRGTIAKRSLRLLRINVSYYKSMLHRLWQVLPGEPGYWSVHADTSEEYFQQITAEHSVWITNKRQGRKVRKLIWDLKPGRKHNHYLDAVVYGMAIADFKGWMRLRDRSQVKTSKPPRTAPNPQAFLEQARSRGRAR